MEVRVITGADALNKALIDLFAWADTVDLAVAWAASGKGKARHWQALKIKKINRAAVGIAFAGTEPEALVALNEGADRLRIVQSRGGGGTFHPKVFLGKRGTGRRAIVGSANLTVGAYTVNTELCVVLDGVESDEQIQALDSFIGAQWRRGLPFDPDWLPGYAKSAKRARAKREDIKVPLLRPKVPALTTLLMTWDEYVEKIRAQDDRILENGYQISTTDGDRSYFRELDDAAKLFRKRGGFAQLTQDERTFLMGEGRASSGLLGSMGGAGTAMHIAQKKALKLSAIDSLPMKGQLTPTEVRSLLEALTKPKGVGLGVATRLMAAKRPDLFVSVNQGSEPQLAAARGGKRIKSIKQYVSFLSDIWGSDWYQAERPQDDAEAAIWDRRAALLDAALYEYVTPR